MHCGRDATFALAPRKLVHGSPHHARGGDVWQQVGVELLGVQKGKWQRCWPIRVRAVRQRLGSRIEGLAARTVEVHPHGVDRVVERTRWVVVDGDPLLVRLLPEARIRREHYVRLAVMRSDPLQGDRKSTRLNS